MQHPRLILASAGLCLLAAMPAAAQEVVPIFTLSDGSVSSVAMQDYNHNGKIDRAVVSIVNASASAWQVHGLAGLKASYQGQPLAIRAAFMASTGNPAKLEVVFDESDPHLPATTAASGFSVTYDQQGAAKGVSDGLTEMAAIAPDFAPLDQAGPVLLSSSPAAGTIDATRDTDLTLTFSEPIVAGSVVPSSSQNPDAWGYTVVGNALIVSHAPYARGVTESYGIDATDAAGNHVAVGAYPNPFGFRTATVNVPTPTLDTVFTMTVPRSLQSLSAGAPNVLAWYTNEADVASVRLSYSKDGGVSYLPMVTRPVTAGTYVWYPPAVSGSISLKAEALNASGTVVNVSVVNAVSVSGSVAAPPRVLGGPDVIRLTDTVAQAYVDFDHAPVSASATCGGKPSTITIVGDRPARLEALAEGLTDAPITCRFVISDGTNAPTTLETPPIAAGTPAPQGEGFLALKDGDLIKSAAATSVYWYKGGKRWVFANADVYRSWFGDDFSKVITVPGAQLGAILIGGNVKMKEGVYLIKIQSDPKTYAVEPGGVLRWIQTEAQAQALYGAAWNKRIRDVDVSLFVDYAIGQPLQDGEKPAGYAG